MQLMHSRHTVGLSNYHLQFTPKYRRDVFRDGVVRKKCRDAFEEVAHHLNITILALEFGPEHAHLFIGNCKNYSIPQLAQHFKGFSSKVMRGECWNRIKGKLWGTHFWSSGYFYEAVGRITSETAQFYIERQQGKHWISSGHDYSRYTKTENQATLRDFISSARYASGFSPE
jgi:putative transposase